MSKILVPDSIEPYIGWKALSIIEGSLFSPQQCVPWPKGAKLEATCRNGHHQPRMLFEHSWQLEKGIPPEIHWYVPGHLSDAVNSTATPTTLVEWDPDVPSGDVPFGGMYYTGGEVNYPDPPDVLPPDGYYWYWKKDEVGVWAAAIQIAGRGCTCGIYAVSTPQECSNYFNSQAVLAQVALWGNVTVAHSGARGQYAYPQKLIIPKRLERVTKQLVQDYDVPCEVAPPERMTVYLGGPHKAIAPNRQDKARAASATFSLAAVAFAVLSLVSALADNYVLFHISVALNVVCLLLMFCAQLESHR